MVSTLSPIAAVLIGWAFVALIMGALWLLQMRTGDAGIVDVAWSAFLGLLAIFYAVTVSGPMPRAALVGVLAAIWSFRLAIYLLKDRIIGKEEDGRYQQIRESQGSRIQTFFFFFFQAQGLLDVILSLPMLVAIINPRPELGPFDFAAIAIWLVSVVGESIADRQLARFRANPDNKGKVCQSGLWRYSRHPNYFFEWLHWWTYVLFAIGGSYWWLSLLGPALMLFFILKVTGIPPTEARAIQSRGDAYRAYQRTTSTFVPWFPKRDET